MPDTARLRTLALSLVCAAAPTPAFAQASYFQGFDAVGPTSSGQPGPSSLVAAGWTFRNQSAPAGTTGWRQGTSSTEFWAPEQGTGFLTIQASVAAYEGQAASWAILPAVPGQRAGDTVSFFARGYQYFAGNNLIELRYAPAGGAATGSGPGGVGDFTQVLASATPDSYSWAHLAAVVPGPGRLALRYTKPNASNDGAVSIDDLTVTGLPLDPPYPAAGQTVHWTPAMSPVQVRSNADIPAGSTVVIDPGVEVRVNGVAALNVAGRLVAHGAAGQRITLTGLANTARIVTSGGALDFDAVDVNVQVGPGGVDAAGRTGEGVFRRCTFGPFGLINGGWEYVEAESCVYSALFGPHFLGQVRLSGFTSTTTIALANGIYVLDGVTVDGPAGETAIDGSGFYYTAGIQPGLFDRVTVRNTAGAGLFVNQGNVLVGSAAAFTNTRLPVQLYFGGLLGGSVVPATGNRNNGYIGVNYADAFPLRSITPATDYSAVWGNVGLPYVVSSAGSSGLLTIEPGVTCYVGPDGIISSGEGGSLRIRGTPEAPISFLPLDPARPWNSLSYFSRGRINDVVVEGSRFGVISYHGAVVDVQNSIFRHNDTAGLHVRARKTRYLENRVGLSNTGSAPGSAPVDADNPANPNAFVGNTVGVEDAFQSCSEFPIAAAHNWWGSPTGPSGSPLNPGGAGDAVSGCVLTLPFLTRSPDFSDHPPLVDVVPLPLLVEEGERVTLHWTVRDDRGVASQRVAYALGTNADESAFVTLADLPPGARSFELTVPASGRVSFRVTAFDTAGQEGFDDQDRIVPSHQGAASGATVIAGAPAAGGTVRPGDRVNLSWASTGFDRNYTDADVRLVLDNDEYTDLLSAGYASGTPFSAVNLPAVSTDSARLAVRVFAGYNLETWTFTPPFSIRPDPRLGDAPPTVAIASPPPGRSVAAGSTVSVSWTAADDQGVRSAKVYVSCNAGRTWQKLAENLPGPAGTFAWPLAPGAGYPDVRLKVVAVDTRFQNTSATVALVVTPGGAVSACPADWNSDGEVNGNDISGYLNSWYADITSGAVLADFNADGEVNGNDVSEYINAWYAAIVNGGTC